MKQYFGTLILLSTWLCYAQYNYVPNPGFESMTEAPNQFDQTSNCVPWRSATYGSTDFLYDSDNGSDVDLPDSYMGYQVPHSGKGYCGLIVYSDNTYSDYKEYLEVRLTDSLIGGIPYKVSFYCSLADYVSTYASKDLGVILSPGSLGFDFQLTSITQVPPPIKADYFISNTTDWVFVEGSYLAQGGETHLTIGSFIYTSDMDVQYVNPAGEGFAYYFIDDVSVMIDTTSSIFGEDYGNGYDNNEPSSNAYFEGGCWYDVIIPNVFTPQGDNLNELWFVKYTGYIKAEVTILDRWGNVVFNSSNFLAESWDGVGSDSGVYFYHLRMMKQNGKFDVFTGGVQVIGLPE